MVDAVKIIWNAFERDKLLRHFSPNELEKSGQEYRSSLGLSPEFKYSGDAFDNYSQARLQTYASFSATRTPSGALISERLKGDSADIKIVQNGLNTALKPSADFDKEHSNFSNARDNFQELIKQIPTKYKPHDVVGAFTELKDSAEKAIQRQQESEIKALEEQFKPSEGNTFIPALKKSLALQSESEVNAIKVSLLTDLRASHKKELKEFNKSTKESITKLHDAATADMREFLFIASLYKNNPAMRAIIDDLTQPKKTNTTLQNTKDPAASFQGVLKQLKSIESLTGKKIEYKDGHYSLEMPSLMAGINYYLDRDQKPKTDMLIMAKAIHASGAKKIKVELNFSDPEEAMKRGRQAYEACIESGFPAKNITIEINGKVYTDKIGEELFKSDPSSWKQCAATEKRIKKELADTEKPKESDIKSIKAELVSLRTQNKDGEAGLDNANSLSM